VKNWTKVVMDSSTRQDLVQNRKKMEGCRKKEEEEEEESYFMCVFNNIGILQIKSTLSKIFVDKLIWEKIYISTSRNSNYKSIFINLIHVQCFRHFPTSK